MNSGHPKSHYRRSPWTSRAIHHHQHSMFLRLHRLSGHATFTNTQHCSIRIRLHLSFQNNDIRPYRLPSTVSTVSTDKHNALHLHLSTLLPLLLFNNDGPISTQLTLHQTHFNCTKTTKGYPKSHHRQSSLTTCPIHYRQYTLSLQCLLPYHATSTHPLHLFVHTFLHFLPQSEGVRPCRLPFVDSKIAVVSNC